jgi:hypothetical protein
LLHNWRIAIDNDAVVSWIPKLVHDSSTDLGNLVFPCLALDFAIRNNWDWARNRTNDIPFLLSDLDETVHTRSAGGTFDGLSMVVDDNDRF